MAQEESNDLVVGITLEGLSPALGSRKSRQRIARGEGSGRGKTSGRGHKGQKARSGVSIPGWFEGGQMPLYRRVRKIGFRSRQQALGQNRYFTVPVSFLDKFDNGAVVDLETLSLRGVTSGPGTRAGIKVLGDGELSKKLTVKVQAVSDSARKKIEAAGGSVEIVAACQGCCTSEC